MKRTTLLLSALLWAIIGYTAAHAQDYGGSTDTFQNALENNRTDQASTWVNPDTGSSGTVAPARTFQNAQGQPCREFQQTIVIGGREEQGYGTACRQPDGTWLIVSGEPEVTVANPAGQRTTVYVRDVVRPYPYYYDPWYRYPYWYPFSFSLSLGHVHHGHHHRGHHGWYRQGWHHDGGHFGGSHHRGGHHRGGHRGGHGR